MYLEEKEIELLVEETQLTLEAKRIEDAEQLQQDIEDQEAYMHMEAAAEAWQESEEQERYEQDCMEKDSFYYIKET